MKNSFAFKPGKILSVFVAIILLFGGCISSTKNTDDDSKCGDIITWTTDERLWYATADYDGSNYINNLYFEDLTAPDDICTDEHTNADFTVFTKSGKQISGWSLKGEVYWGGFYKETCTIKWDDLAHDYTGYISGIGLKDAYGDASGWVGIHIIVTLGSSGDINNDRQKVTDSLTEMIATYTYHKTK